MKAFTEYRAMRTKRRRERLHPTLSFDQIVVLALAVVAGCAAAPPPVTATLPVVDPAPANAARFRGDEDALLGALSVLDARLAIRFGRQPSQAELSQATMSAVIAGDSSLAVHEGALDVFSFDSRARGFEAASKSVGTWTYPLTGDATLERVLVMRMIAEEKARLDEEKRLPVSASELVRALVLTWSAAATPAELKGKDGWLARRIDDLHGSLKSDALATIELNELDDALDALERLTVGYAGTAAALARLRVALAEAHPAASPRWTWKELQTAALAHLGVRLDLATLRTELERLRLGLGEQIALKNKGLTRDEVRELGARAEPLVLVDGTCNGPPPLRAFVPPPERAPICGLLLALLRPAEDRGAPAAIVALHDDASVALWALAIHGERLDPNRAAEKYPLASGIPFEREVRLLRRAVVRPVGVLAAAWAAIHLVRENKPDLQLAERWRAFGDAPLDVVASELALTSARGLRASPPP